MTTNSLPQSEVEFEQSVYATGSAIPIEVFQVVNGVVFALAIICAVARSVMRFITHRPLYWDDFFLALGSICFVVATGILFKNKFYYYLSSALQFNPSLTFSTSIETLGFLLTVALPQLTAVTACVWTTIFCVKASFLIISKRLIDRLPWLNIYFWLVTVFTACSWAILICVPFIECPYTGWDSIGKCQGSYRNSIYVAMNATIAGLDILTDILIASIPIIVLWRAKLKSQQKFIVGPFLCLSLVMIVFAIIRVSKLHDATSVDICWLAFWQYLEGGIAIIVTSITTLRTVFTAQRKSRALPATTSTIYGSDRSGRNKKQASETVNTVSSSESHAMVPGNTFVSDLSSDLAPQDSQIFVLESWDITYDHERTRQESEGK